MTTRIYTVYEKGDPAQADAVFVREGFTIFGFVFSFMWLLYHRVWLAGCLVLALFIVLSIAPGMFDLPLLVAAGLRLVLQLAVGLFAFDLWRDALERRGYQFAGVAAAGSKEEAELRYYARHETVTPAPGPALPDAHIVTA